MQSQFEARTTSVLVKAARKMRWIVVLGCVSVGVLLVIANLEHLRRAEIRLVSLIGQRAGIRSFELGDLPRRATYAESVLAWISQHRRVIVVEASRRRVDPRAVAGVIAYEALENPLPREMAGIVRFSGPGKVHYEQFHTREGDPVARQVEFRGYLPRQSVFSRKQILSTPTGAIRYIAAIMAAFSDIASHNGYRIRCRPGMLATFFNGWDLISMQHFVETHRKRPLRRSVVGIWVDRHSLALASALQIRPFPNCDTR